MLPQIAKGFEEDQGRLKILHSLTLRFQQLSPSKKTIIGKVVTVNPLCKATQTTKKKNKKSKKKKSFKKKKYFKMKKSSKKKSKYQRKKKKSKRKRVKRKHKKSKLLLSVNRV